MPSTAAAVVMGASSVGFGLLWLFITFDAGGAFGLFFPLFGVLFIAVGIGMSIYQFRKARRYQRAYRNYLDRRSAIMGDLRRDRDEND